MTIRLTNPLPETMRLRDFSHNDVLEVEHISTDLEGRERGDRKKGYLVSDKNKKPLTLYSEEIQILNSEITIK